jgi:hypothetical protein
MQHHWIASGRKAGIAYIEYLYIEKKLRSQGITTFFLEALRAP